MACGLRGSTAMPQSASPTIVDPEREVRAHDGKPARHVLEHLGRVGVDVVDASDGSARGRRARLSIACDDLGCAAPGPGSARAASPAGPRSPPRAPRGGTCRPPCRVIALGQERQGLRHLAHTLDVHEPAGVDEGVGPLRRRGTPARRPARTTPRGSSARRRSCSPGTCARSTASRPRCRRRCARPACSTSATAFETSGRAHRGIQCLPMICFGTSSWTS